MTIRLFFLIVLFVLTSLSMLPAAAVYSPRPGEGKYILTPKPQPAPAIHGPSVFGVKPGSPFLYTIAATGIRPMKFSAESLPAGLSLNETTGIITGTIRNRSEQAYSVILKAENKLGTDQKPFRIIVGSTICLTPPLGWNSWNCWKKQVTQDHVLASARAMVEKGLINYGWTYINIDDAWQGTRGGPFNGIQANPEKFPDIKKMCDEIHAMGLKVGIYSTPWITSYAGYVGGSSNHPDGSWKKEIQAPPGYNKDHQFWTMGKYPFDRADAAQWAQWGIDYLKYDWNPNDPESTVRMANALKNCGRDIVYSLSNSAPLEHAQLFGRYVNCWRTAGDLKDRWDQEGAHLNIRQQWEYHRNWLEKGVRGGPGHFPDADMLVVGHVVTSSKDGRPVPSRLTADEQYSHITLWVLWSCPLLIGCPIEMMDDFTLNLLTNSEVLAVHQDSVAIPGHSVLIDQGIEIIVKDLENGAKAIGLFNTNPQPRIVQLDWKLAGLKGAKTIRDLWRQKDIGIYTDIFSGRVPSHGVLLISAR